MTNPSLRGIVETGLYVENLARSVRFYQDVLGLSVLIDASPRLVALRAGERSVLLLFQRGQTGPSEMPAGKIPGHGASGVQHFAFAVDDADLSAWEARLQSHGVEIEGRAHWTPAGRSTYFRDPDGHSLELLTPGFWKNY